MDLLFYAGIGFICIFIAASGVSHGRIGLWTGLLLGSVSMFGWATALTSLPLA
jgi:hypothetical protein